MHWRLAFVHRMQGMSSAVVMHFIYTMPLVGAARNERHRVMYSTFNLRHPSQATFARVPGRRFGCVCFILNAF